MDRSNSDMMTGQQKRTLDPESANPAKRLKTSHIPDQLRHLIWHELRCTGASGEGAAIATTPYLSMSDNEYVQENQKIVEGEKVVELVNQDRSESYQGRPDEYDPNSIAEYCSEVCGSYIFVFKTSGGLDRFAQLVQTTLSVKPNLVFHPEGIELDIFEGRLLL